VSELPPPDPAWAAGADARILDRGYRPYTGARLGERGAIQSLVLHTARRVLGIRRNARTKVLPIVTGGIAYVPAIVFVGIAAFIRDNDLQDSFLPTYGEYYSFVTLAILLFTAFVAPEALCPDRRSGMLGLYLASPLTRDTYLVAKGVSVGGLLALTTLGPPMLLLVANTLQGIGPDGPGDVALVFGRVVLAGVVLSAFFTSLSLACAACTDRRAIASAAIILLLFVTAAVTSVLVDPVGAPDWVNAFNLAAAPFELARRVFGEPGEVPEISTVALVVADVVVTVACSTLVWLRYRRLAVTK
jgi:ABC-2 type transport system permease protein